MKWIMWNSIIKTKLCLKEISKYILHENFECENKLLYILNYIQNDLNQIESGKEEFENIEMLKNAIIKILKLSLNKNKVNCDYNLYI